MTDSAGIARDPLARAALAKLAATHGRETPLGSFARAVLAGEAGLREAADHPWHGEALGRAFVEAVHAQRELDAETRDEIEQAARKLREASDAGLLSPHAGNDVLVDNESQEGDR